METKTARQLANETVADLMEKCLDQGLTDEARNHMTDLIEEVIQEYGDDMYNEGRGGC